jgi:hypothetical protein
MKTMKQFANIQDWLKNKPTEQEMTRVLEFINKNVKYEMKREFYKKQSELKKMNRLISDLNEVGFKPTKDMEERYAEKVKEVETLNLEIGVPEKKEKPPKKDKKEENTIASVESETSNGKS